MGTTSPLIAALQVAAGGAIGAVLRWGTGEALSKWHGSSYGSFPYSTLLVNILGSLLMGVLAGWLLRTGGEGDFWRLFLGVGLLGGFTTFSAFSLELLLLIERGALSLALLYAAVSVVAGLAALWLGYVLTRSMA